MRSYYFINSNNERKGPYSVEELSRRISPDTLVWTEGMTSWKVAYKVEELACLFPQTTTKKSKSLIIVFSLILIILLIGAIIFMLNNKGNGNVTPDDTVTSTVVPPSETQHLQEPVVKQPHKLTVTKVDAFCHLDPQAGHTYIGENMLDGDPATVWACHLDENLGIELGRSYGPSFKVKCSKLAYVVIRNGYGRDTNSFKNNTRAGLITIYKENDFPARDGGEGNDIEELYNGRLMDTNEPQKLRIPEGCAANHDIQTITIFFGEPINKNAFYWGKKWSDLCISEVEFWGY